HGDEPALDARECRVPDDAAAGPRRWRRDALGLFRERAPREGALRRPGVPALPPGLPARLPPEREGARARGARREAGRRVEPGAGVVGLEPEAGSGGRSEPEAGADVVVDRGGRVLGPPVLPRLLARLDQEVLEGRDASDRGVVGGDRP